MTLKQEGRYPAIRVIGFGVVFPLLSLWYLAHSISIFANTHFDAFKNGGADGLWALVKGIFLIFVGFCSFCFAHITHQREKEQIAKAKQEALAQDYLVKQELKQDTLIRDMATRSAKHMVWLIEQEGARAEEIEALKSELLELQNTHYVSADLVEEDTQ